MNTRIESINGNEWRFENEYKETRNGFKHHTRLFKNGKLFAENTSHYINRTWESYRFQSSMRCCVWQLIEEEEELAKRVFKKCNNIKRLTKNKKAEMMLELEQQQDYKELKELLDRLENR